MYTPSMILSWPLLQIQQSVRLLRLRTLSELVSGASHMDASGLALLTHAMRGCALAEHRIKNRGPLLGRALW